MQRILFPLLCTLAMCSCADYNAQPIPEPCSETDSTGSAECVAEMDTVFLSTIVREREAAFARTMAMRDLEAFAAFVADEAIFYSASGPLRGKEAILSAWKPFFDGPDAPFSWQPEEVNVLASGDLAWSSGPVFAPDSTRIATFHSIWRLDADGTWRIIFDRGEDLCDCEAL